MDSANRAIERVAAGRESFACDACGRVDEFSSGKYATAYGWRRVEGSERWLCPFCVGLGSTNRRGRRAARALARKAGVT